MPVQTEPTACTHCNGAGNYRIGVGSHRQHRFITCGPCNGSGQRIERANAGEPLPAIPDCARCETSKRAAQLEVVCAKLRRMLEEQEEASAALLGTLQAENTRLRELLNADVWDAPALAEEE